MELLGRGRTADVYRTDDNKALKLYHAHISENLIAHESQISKAVGHICKTAPDFYGITTIEGQKGLLYQLIEGTALIEMVHRENVLRRS